MKCTNFHWELTNAQGWWCGLITHKVSSLTFLGNLCSHLLRGNHYSDCDRGNGVDLTTLQNNVHNKIWRSKKQSLKEAKESASTKALRQEWSLCVQRKGKITMPITEQMV